MRGLSSRERLAVGVWIVLTLVVWNGVYDFLMFRGIKEYLLRNALHLAGRGPEVSMTALLDRAIDEAFWLSTLWASATLLAGMWTVRFLRARAAAGPARRTWHVERRT